MITARAAATFDPVGRSVATARAFVRDTLQGWGFADIVDDAVVLTSELVTNAVVHAGTAADVLCLRTRGRAYASRSPTATRSARCPLQSRPQHRQPRPRRRPRPAALRGPRLPLGRRVHADAQTGLVPTRPPRSARSAPAPPARLPPTALLPLADSRVRVAVVQIDRMRHHLRLERGRGDALRLRRRAGHRQAPHRLRRLAAHPGHRHRHRRGAAALPLGGQLRHPRRRRPRRSRCTPPTCAYATRDGEPSTVCLLVRDHERAVLQSPLRGPAADTAARDRGPTPPTRSRSSSAPPPRTTSTACSSAPSSAPATCSTATPPSCCSPPTTRPSWRSAPPPASPPPASASPASPWRRAPAATAPPACRPSTRTSRVVPGAVPLLDRHRHALGRHRPAQGRGPPHRLPRRRRRGAGPLLERGGPAPPVRRRPHRARRRVAPASASWSGCAAARSPSSSRRPTCSPAPWTATRRWR